MLFSISPVPAGTVLPSSVFPQSFTVVPQVLASYHAGDLTTAPLTLPAGTLIPAGTVLPTPAAIKPVLTLDSGLLASGFTSYNITSGAGLLVTDGANLKPVVPVYQFAATSFAARSGGGLAATAELWLPPAYLDDPVAAKVTPRIGAALTLASLGDFTLQREAAIAADPGKSVSILANGQTTIDGRITVPGGTISVNSVVDAAGQAQVAGRHGSFSLTRSVWIGEDAVLDVSGTAVIAQDRSGRSYGTVSDGGTIQLGGTGWLIRPAMPSSSSARAPGSMPRARRRSSISPPGRRQARHRVQGSSRATAAASGSIPTTASILTAKCAPRRAAPEHPAARSQSVSSAASTPR
ncbi:hypothetical protein [Bradyrhizobium sp. SK17]|uniref:hypothetical protein n=1 Tax=Bradyrhizobium sp. SK17 TaxID=2057741 RepID=UPI0012FDBA39|nr:hypothetical protein [Bradyrhizobium sp. SK17]